MNTIEKLGDDETFRNIVERTITEFEDSEVEVVGNNVFNNCTELTSASFPVATAIWSDAFSHCSKLTSVSAPVATSIGMKVFWDCTALTSVSFPKVTSIGTNVFKDCTALTSVSFPKVTSIDDSNYGMFGGCTALTSISFPVLTKIADSMFSRCSALTSASFPIVTSIGSSAFYNCSKLTSASFPVATHMGEAAFSNCSALTSVSFPKLTSIRDSDTFRNCNKLTTMYIGTESNTVCTLANTYAIPSSVTKIYVPFSLVDNYKTATNWSKFASKIQAYDVPVSCQSLTITAEDVPGYKTTTTIHYEAVCTYSIEGMMQTGTKVFKGDAVSDTFSTNPSEESSRQVEVSYTFLGQTATTTITQDKYLGNSVGGKIYYIDDTADGTYSFYDAEGNLMPDVSVGSTPSYYKVLTAGSKDKYYVYHDKIYTSLKWGKYNTTTGASGIAIGTGKSNTAILLASDVVSSTTTIWYKLQQIRNASTGGHNDWFVPSKDEIEKLRLAVDSGSITGGTIAGSSYAGSVFKSKNLWSSSESSAPNAWLWDYYRNNWHNDVKGSSYSVFFARAF